MQVRRNGHGMKNGASTSSTCPCQVSPPSLHLSCSHLPCQGWWSLRVSAAASYPFWCP